MTQPTETPAPTPTTDTPPTQGTTNVIVQATERTMQVVIIIFAALIAAVVAFCVGCMGIIVLRDGNSQLVSDVASKLTTLGIAGFAAIVLMITGRAVALQFLQKVLG